MLMPMLTHSRMVSVVSNRSLPASSTSSASGMKVSTEARTAPTTALMMK
jgi:hypothetical protein